MKFSTRQFSGLFKPNPQSFFRKSEKGVPQEEGTDPKNLKSFVYEQILIKLGTRWFVCLLKPYLKSLFRNSKKGPLRGGGWLTNLSNFMCLSKKFAPNQFKFFESWEKVNIQSNLHTGRTSRTVESHLLLLLLFLFLLSHLVTI